MAHSWSYSIAMNPILNTTHILKCHANNDLSIAFLSPFYRIHIHIQARTLPVIGDTAHGQDEWSSLLRWGGHIVSVRRLAADDQKQRVYKYFKNELSKGEKEQLDALNSLKLRERTAIERQTGDGGISRSDSFDSQDSHTSQTSYRSVTSAVSNLMGDGTGAHRDRSYADKGDKGPVGSLVASMMREILLWRVQVSRICILNIKSPECLLYLWAVGV